MKNLISLLTLCIGLVSCENENAVEEQQVCNNTYVGNVTLLTQQDVDDFGALGYCEISGFLYIGQHYGFDNDILDLSPLSSITKITRVEGSEHSGKLIIFTYNLPSLMGLHNIKSVASLKISICNELTDLNGLNGLEEVTGFNADFGGTFFITDNSQLSSLEGLENLRSIGLNSTGIFEFRVIGTGLNSLTGLNNLTSIKGKVLIGGIPRLLDLTGLEGLKSVDGDFAIAANHDLLSLEGLNNLQSVSGNLTIGANSNLLNLDALSSLLEVNGTISTLAIPVCNGCTPSPIGNSNLADLCGLENLFTNGSYGEVNIEDNAYNPSVQDIIDGNCAE